MLKCTDNQNSANPNSEFYFTYIKIKNMTWKDNAKYSQVILNNLGFKCKTIIRKNWLHHMGCGGGKEAEDRSCMSVRSKPQFAL